MWKIGVYIVLIMNIVIITLLVIFFLREKNDVDIYFQSLMA